MNKAKSSYKLDNDSFLDVARHLHQVLEKSPDTFNAVAKELGLSRRKAYYLVEIDRAFAKLKVDGRRLKAIGWTKLRLIAPKIAARNCEELLKLAENKSAYDLGRLMGDEDADPDAKAHAVLLYLTPDQYEVFRDVLEAHGAKVTSGGISDKEEALTTALKKLKRLNK
ncbi:hypothetical protein [Hyphomicrobium sp.]|uniref:hypothetical protein n=1 Tax=Hyphomicrobium sp. TaxID=82 RepID=UPI003F72B438